MQKTKAAWRAACRLECGCEVEPAWGWADGLVSPASHPTCPFMSRHAGGRGAYSLPASVGGELEEEWALGLGNSSAKCALGVHAQSFSVIPMRLNRKGHLNLQMFKWRY